MEDRVAAPYGGEIVTWGALATVYAEVRQQGGREFLPAQQMMASKRVVFYLRWTPGLTVTDHVEHDGVIHNIEEVREIGRRDGLELHTVATA
ncbi:phage head closure protein [Sphingobium sp. JS3065]|uniref:phage head closure protein n=1 Tax=Sphingobium sp. JS3065 TaxID=2970925 RepID=UPI0022640759|nr:phage head closure protein [Sphingobium sp. JS3065]UZW56959.1 phage head closure protein [Sphingobium sp. JS3065]